MPLSPLLLPRSVVVRAVQPGLDRDTAARSSGKNTLLGRKKPLKDSERLSSTSQATKPFRISVSAWTTDGRRTRSLRWVVQVVSHYAAWGLFNPVAVIGPLIPSCVRFVCSLKATSALLSAEQFLK